MGNEQNVEIQESDNIQDNQIYDIEPTTDSGLTTDQIISITDKVKEQYKNNKIFRIIVPYIGIYFIKAQNYSDVLEANRLVMIFIDSKIESVGGNTEIDKLPDENRNKFMRELDEEISDLSNKETLKRCVVYPDNFPEKVDAGNIESGLMSLLLEKIMDISGWVDPIVEEI